MKLLTEVLFKKETYRSVPIEDLENIRRVVNEVLREREGEREETRIRSLVVNGFTSDKIVAVEVQYPNDEDPRYHFMLLHEGKLYDSQYDRGQSKDGHWKFYPWWPFEPWEEDMEVWEEDGIQGLEDVDEHDGEWDRFHDFVPPAFQQASENCYQFLPSKGDDGVSAESYLSRFNIKWMAVPHDAKGKWETFLPDTWKRND